MLLYMCVVYAMFSRYFSIWHNFCPARNFVQQGFDMNLAFCNQEKQRNEVCCGILFLHLFSLIVWNLLKSKSHDSMHFWTAMLITNFSLNGTVVFMPGKRKLVVFESYTAGETPTAVGWKLKTVQLVSCLDWVIYLVVKYPRSSHCSFMLVILK